MPPTTAQERQRKRRERLKASGEYETYKLKNASYGRKYRTKEKERISKLSRTDQAILQQQKRENDRKRQQKCRFLKRMSVQTPQTKMNEAKSPLSYSSTRTLSKASNRVKSVLPSSPGKKHAVIKRLASEFRVSMTWPKKNSRISRLAMDTIDAVRDYYRRDDISRISPGKRDVVTIRDDSGKTKLQKRHMTMSIKETYASFKEENPNIKIGLSKFAELRPNDVKLSSETPVNVCQCTYHQNFIMAVDALHKYLPDVPVYSTAFPSSCLESPDDEKCWFGECTHTSCGFSSKYPLPEDPEVRKMQTKWKKWQEVSSHLIKKEVSGTLQELYNYVSSSSVKFLEHCFIKRQQSASYEEDKRVASCPTSDFAVLQMDFAENYTCSSQDEVQSAHWNQAQVTLYTSVMWSREKIKSHVIISDYMSHDKTAVVVFVDELLSTVSNEVNLVKIWSDGPASQFKNRFVMKALPMLAEKHNIDLEWNFSATSHGKGPVDGIGATLKRKASELVKNRRCSIYTAQEFCGAVKDSTITTTLITARDVEDRSEALNLSSIFRVAKPLKGISSLHYVTYMYKSGQRKLVTKRFTAQKLSP